MNSKKKKKKKKKKKTTTRTRISFVKDGATPQEHPIAAPNQAMPTETKRRERKCVEHPVRS